MTHEDNFIGQVEAYLDEFQGVTPLPDVVRSAVRAEVPRTRQVAAGHAGPMGRLRMSMSMPAPVRYGLLVAGFVAAVILGAELFGRAVGGPPARTPSPSAVTLEPEGDAAPLRAGSYAIASPFPVRLRFDVPEGTSVFHYTQQASQVNLSVGGSGETSFEIIDNVTADPCTGLLLNPPVGPSVQDLVTALSNMPGFRATVATDVAIDGFRGKQFILTAPGDADASCSSMLTWMTTTRQNGVGPNEVNELTILDVDGVRLLICVAYQPSTPVDERARLQAIVRSLELAK